MLRELSVQNLALIEDARVDLRPGFCAWTGETGAGKSLLLTALGLVLGGRASADLVRAGKPEARASAVFEVESPPLRAEVESALGGPLDDETLILTRRITPAGKSSAHANGLPVSAATLRRLGGLLVDLHGQHETLQLLDPRRQRAWLDAHGGLRPLVDGFNAARDAYETLRRRRLTLLESADRRERERALATFELEELTALDPRPGEVEELNREAHRLANLEALRSASADGYRLLYEADRSAQGLIETVAKRLESLGDASPEFADAAGELARIADETREIAYALRTLGRSFDDDPARLDGIEARLARYRKLAARFKTEPDRLDARRREVEARLASIEKDDADLAAFDVPLARTREALVQAAAKLSDGRRKAADAFAKAVKARLKSLSLGDAGLTVVVEAEPMGDDLAAPAPPPDGADRVEFLFSPNPGESPRPLRRIASGGELSRVALAVKVVLAAADAVPTLVFDEIDTGVGGRLGTVLGGTLAELSAHHQVVCVTHLPQLACRAAHQWAIRKRTEKGRAETTIVPLSDDERVDELAAMLRGDSAAAGTRREARSMLREARLPRPSTTSG